MKKIISFIISGIVILNISAQAADIDLSKNNTCYFFAGTEISNIDYNGETFVGICANKIVVSRDFEKWAFLATDLPDVQKLTRFNGEFIAVGKGKTLKSSNGTDWTVYNNNLPAPLRDFAKNTKAMMTFVYDYDFDTKITVAGTFTSTNGVDWMRVDNIPDGGGLKVINDQFVTESAEYMQGIYISENGLDFRRLNVSGNSLTFYDNAYHTLEYSTENSGYNYLWSSNDLSNWTKNKFYYEQIYPHNSIFFTMDGKEQAYNLNGSHMVFENGNWVAGNNPIVKSFAGTNPPFVYYNTSEYGLFAWSTEQKSYYLPDYKNSRVYDHKKYNLYRLQVQNDAFYAITNFNYSPDSGKATYNVFESFDGMNWSENTTFKYDYKNDLDNKATNGNVFLEAEFIERGSYAGYETNKEITAKLIEKNGKVSTVAYEDAKYDTVEIQGGNGYFLMRIAPDLTYYSPDGITRYSCPYGYLNSKVMIKPVTNAPAANILEIYDVKQLENINLPPSIKVMLNGEYLSFATAPVIEQGRALVPIRFLFERAGATVDWDGETKTAIIKNNDNEIRVQVDNNIAIVNGEPKQLDVPARLINDKTLVPLRFLSEYLGYRVKWDAETRTVFIDSSAS